MQRQGERHFCPRGPGTPRRSRPHDQVPVEIFKDDVRGTMQRILHVGWLHRRSRWTKSGQTSDKLLVTLSDKLVDPVRVRDDCLALKTLLPKIEFVDKKCSVHHDHSRSVHHGVGVPPHSRGPLARRKSLPNTRVQERNCRQESDSITEMPLRTTPLAATIPTTRQHQQQTQRVKQRHPRHSQCTTDSQTRLVAQGFCREARSDTYADRWEKGTLMGKIDQTNELVLIALSGVVKSRVVKRKHDESLFDIRAVRLCYGLPWAYRDVGATWGCDNATGCAKVNRIYKPQLV